MKKLNVYMSENARRYNSFEEIIADIAMYLDANEILNPDYKRLADAGRREFGRDAKLYKDVAYMTVDTLELRGTNNAISDYIWTIPWDSFQELGKFRKGLDTLKKTKFDNKEKPAVDMLINQGENLYKKWAPIANDLKTLRGKIVKVTQKRAEAKAVAATNYAKKVVDYTALTKALETHKMEYIRDYKRQAISFLDRKINELEKVDWDLNKIVGSGYTRNKELRSFYYTITSSANKGYNPNKDAPDLRMVDSQKTKSYVDRAIKTAEDNYAAFVYKMIEKVGAPVTHADMTGNIWKNSTLKVTTINNEDQVWHTQAILNFSKYGKPFNQFPTRRKK